MQQLSATDASFLYAETPRMPMHVMALQLYDPGTASTNEVSIEHITDNVRRRVQRIDCFHRKLLDTPWRLDHPQWIDDGSFDASEHVFAHALAAPGGWLALCEMVAQLDAQPLDRRRPLWEMHVISHLGSIPNVPPDAFAVVTKIHHAAVDGVAGIGVTLALHDLEPEGTEAEPAPIDAERIPTPMQLIARAVAKEAFRPARLYQAWPALARLATAWGQLPPVSVAPRTRFNGRVAKQRVFDAVRLPLDGLQARKKRVADATINDVVLAIVGGAMRRYLQSHGELPRRTLTAMVPTNTRRQSARPVGGNQISQIIAVLGTDIAKARDRLRAIQASTAQAKLAANRIDAATLDTVSAVQPAWWVALAATSSGLPTGAPFNTVVTNVKGPQMPLYTCGAKLLSAYGAGPLADGMGIFHTALSYCGELSLSVLACAESLPDIGFYMDCLRLEYDAF